MKIESQHRTVAIGKDSEYFFEGLSGLYNNPNGLFRPDFITSNGNFNPKLSIELKSGRNKKGVLCDYQLRYATTLHEDYGNLFGEKVNNREIAYYYDLICRKDDIPAREFEAPFSTIKLTWGDQYIIPAEMSFYIFAIRKAMRVSYRSIKSHEKAREQKRKIPQIITPETALQYTMKGLQYMVENESDENGNSWSSHPNKDSQSWQSLEGRDIEAIFKRDYNILSKHGRERINLLENYYPLFEKLVRIKIPSTEKSQIYVLCEEKHTNLFDKQFRKAILLNKSKMEELIEERKECENLLSKIECEEIEIPVEKNFFEENNYSNQFETIYRIDNLSSEEIKKLRRLSFWAPNGTKLLGFSNDGREISDSFEGYEEEVIDEKIEGVPF